MLSAGCICLDLNRDPASLRSAEGLISEVETHALLETPVNTALYSGAVATFHCSSNGSNARIQWWEWASSGDTQPQMISDQGVLVNHPWRSKYEIKKPSSKAHYLVIRDVQYSDAGRYTCVDAAGGPPCGNGNRTSMASADLTVISEKTMKL